MEFSFTIGEEEWEVPQTVTLEGFSKAMVWDPRKDENKKMFVSSLTGCPPYLLNTLEPEIFDVIFLACITNTSIYELELKEQVGIYRLKDFTGLSFGEFIDLDLYINNGTIEHAVEIASIIYDMPINIAAQQDYRQMWEAISLIFKWRQNIYKEYAEFFEVEDRDTDEPGKTWTLQRLQLMWYEATLVLAEHKFLNIHLVTQRPVKEALNFLTWKKSEVAKQKLENLKRKNELSRRR